MTRFHTGSWVFICDGRRDYVGVIQDITETQVTLGEVCWITRVSSVISFLKEGWKSTKAAAKWDNFSEINPEHFIVVSLAANTFHPWNHGKAPK